MIDIYQYSYKNSIMNTLNPKSKIIFFLLITLITSFINNIYGLLIMLLISIVLTRISKISVHSLLKSIKSGIKIVLLTSLFILLFSEGTPLFQFKELVVTKQGLNRFVIMNIRFICIFIFMFILFYTTHIVVVLETLKLMKVPEIMIDITLFSYRYIYELEKDILSMKQAMFTRGYNSLKFNSFNEITYLFGNLFVRSYEQSNRIYNSMILRGYSINKNKSGDGE